MKTEKQDRKISPIKSVPAGHRTLVVAESLWSAIGVQPANPAVTLTRQKAAELSGLSLRTIDRMIALGRESVAA